MKKISIIIPAHNEEKRIDATLERYGEFFSDLNKKKKEYAEILVVINNTTDNTEGVVKIMSKKYPIIKFLNLKPKGKGFAIIEGFKDSLAKNFDLIGFVDADMSTNPEHFYWLIKSINKNDGAIASRALKESKVKMSLKRKITHKGFNFLVRILLFLPYKDTQCGAKIFKREALEQIVNELGLTQWGFDVDLLYKLKKRGLKIKEIRTVWEDKGGSKINLKKVPIRMFASVIRLRLLNSRFKKMVDFYDKLPEKIKIHHKI
ncbi:MAG: glycosyltransferase [Candidatus Pacearchaeota archaeon]